MSNLTPNRLTEMGALQISEREALSGETYRAHCMNYWLDKMPAEDMMKLWQRLQAGVRDVQPHILLDVWASGTILNRDFRVVVTANTTGNGFVMTFTVKDT